MSGGPGGFSQEELDKHQQQTTNVWQQAGQRGQVGVRGTGAPIFGDSNSLLGLFQQGGGFSPSVNTPPPEGQNK